MKALTCNAKTWLSVPFVFTSTFLISIWSFRENIFNFERHQIVYSGDGLLFLFFFKALKSASWPDFFMQNTLIQNYGWPNKSGLISYPIGNTVDLTALRIFAKLFPNIQDAEILHIFTIMRFSLIAVFTFIFLRYLKINVVLSFLGSYAFTFMPFNLIRAEGHFVLGSTWTIPLGFLCVYAISNKPKINSLTTISSYFGLFICGMNNLYYAIFLFFILLFVSMYQSHSPVQVGIESNSISRSQNRRLQIAIIAMVSLTAGLSTQIVPNIIGINSSNSLYEISDRSPIESIVYAGNLESFLYDSSKFFLDIIGRQDLSNFLATRISWEGSQSGALAGILFYLIFIVFITYIYNRRVRLRFHNFLHKPEVQYIFLILLISIVLYVPNPLNFAFSYLFGGIRAWGRLVPFITLSCLTLGLLLLDSFRNKLLKLTLIAIAIAIVITELTTFRNSRPPAIILNDSARSEYKYFQNIVDNINLPSKCSIVYLPYYPFPEFDTPRDSAGDYENLTLSTMTKNNFKWSLAAFKGSIENNWLQNLQSEVPPFNRVDIWNQLAYVSNSKPCLILIDKKLLYQDENGSFTKVAMKLNSEKSGNICLKTLDTQDRYFGFDSLDPKCLGKLRDVVNEEIWQMNKVLYAERIKSNYSWRNITVGGQKFNSYFEEFNLSGNSQEIELINYRKNEREDLILVSLISNLQQSEFNVGVCINVDLNKKIICKNSPEIGSFETKSVSFSLNSMNFNIRKPIRVSITQEDSNIGSWSAFIISKKSWEKIEPYIIKQFEQTRLN